MRASIAAKDASIAELQARADKLHAEIASSKRAHSDALASATTASTAAASEHSALVVQLEAALASAKQVHPDI